MLKNLANLTALMQITFLGTSCAKPTKERNHSGIYLSYGGDGILFDCGEGTQRQITIAGIKPTSVNMIFISHWHGDHVLGLPGIVQTLGISEYANTLRIYGPKGTKKRFNEMMNAVVFDNRINIELYEGTGKIVDNEDYYIEAEELEHKTETIGFRFVEKDKRRMKTDVLKKIGVPEGPEWGKLQNGHSIIWKGKKIEPDEVTYIVKGKIISYISDSVPSANSLKLAKDADLLICESTYSSKMQEKAEANWHMTSKQAAIIAKSADVKKLVLTHFSTRYKETGELLEDAKEEFEDVVCAYDFMKIKL
jgi:ribonuclease Z